MWVGMIQEGFMEKAESGSMLEERKNSQSQRGRK
jgi:hypothetical protein